MVEGRGILQWRGPAGRCPCKAGRPPAPFVLRCQGSGRPLWPFVLRCRGSGGPLWPLVLRCRGSGGKAAPRRHSYTCEIHVSIAVDRMLAVKYNVVAENEKEKRIS